ncbi:hypothetical protein ACFSJU_17315 [Paradesertivirga mongoliensis]|uniref:Uncharacterized protein n=1 Tax=Paradesertivirga mongoliensis TaxID=2100740 RepID=A0ABW4ZRG9_9SPHI|nr:hypothetical protein [Pedobacter mongoliensis]
MNSRKLFALLILCVSFSCTKKTDPGEDHLITSDTLISSTVLYIDTARIYSTDLTGANRKLVVGNSGSDIKKIISASILPGSGNVLYAYLPKSSNVTKIAVASLDGSTTKLIKEVTATVQFVKGISYDRIYYGTHTAFPGSFEFRWMKADASSDTRNNYTPLAPVLLREEEISSEGRGFLVNGSKVSTFIPLFNNNVSQNESRTVVSSTSDFVVAPILSAKANKTAYVVKSTVTDQYHIKIKDISVDGPEETVYTLTIPSTGVGGIVNPVIHLCWVNGTKSLLISYGRFSSPSGAASDFTSCQVLDISLAAIIKSWTFTGDGNITMIAD